LSQRFGFSLGVLHIHELSTEHLQIGLPYLGDDDISSILYWTELGNFEITLGGGDSWWADLSGKVHTT
jgi:hypothetical protein